MSLPNNYLLWNTNYSTTDAEQWNQQHHRYDSHSNAYKTDSSGEVLDIWRQIICIPVKATI